MIFFSLPHHTPQRARLFLGRLHPGGVIGSEEGQVLPCIAEVRLDIHAETTWPETHQLWTMKPSVVQINCILKQRVRWATFLSSPDSARTRNTQLHDSAIERRRRRRRCHGDDHDGDCTFLLFCVTGPTKMHAEHESDTAQSRTQIRNCEHKASATAEAENVAHSAPDGVKQYGRHSSRCGQPHGEAPTMSEIDHELS